MKQRFFQILKIVVQKSIGNIIEFPLEIPSDNPFMGTLSSKAATGCKPIGGFGLESFGFSFRILFGVQKRSSFRSSYPISLDLFWFYFGFFFGISCKAFLEKAEVYLYLNGFIGLLQFSLYQRNTLNVTCVMVVVK